MDELDERLAELRTHLDTGPVPDVAPAVMRRIRSEPAPVAVRRRLVALVAAAAAALLTAGLLAVPAVRAAVVDLLSLPGVVFDRDRPQPPSPTVTPSGPLGAAYRLTTPITLEEARRSDAERAPVPSRVGPPDEVYVTGEGNRRVVHLLWRATPELPALPGSAAGLYVMTFSGEADAMVKKLIGGSMVREVSVGGQPALWIGVNHGTALFGSDGLPDYGSERVAGPTLLMDRGDHTVRIESGLARADAIALAESLG